MLIGSNRRRHGLLASLIAGALLLAFSLTGCGGEPSDTRTIAVIPKGSTHEFWLSIHAGAAKAADELGIDITWVGPEKEDDRQQQIALVDNQVLSGVDGIVLAPLDEMALRRPVQDAVSKGIPVVIVDSDLADSEDVYTSFVATDNREGGRLAGQHLGEMLGGEGTVIMLRYAEGSASTTNREAGFMEAIAAFPGIEVVSDEQYGGATRASAQQASDNLLLRFQDASGSLTVDGIFTPNSSTTYGMLQALRRQRLTADVAFVGFDADEALVEAMQEGDIDGLVVQNPFQMGYLGVKTLVAHLDGQPVEKQIDTGVTLVTPENLNDEAIQELIKPDLDRWLNPE